MRRERRPARRYFINTNELHQVHRRARNSQNTQASDDTAALMKGIKDSDVPEDGLRLSLCFSERERAQQQFPWRPKSMLWQRRRERGPDEWGRDQKKKSNEPLGVLLIETSAGTLRARQKVLPIIQGRRAESGPAAIGDSISIAHPQDLGRPNSILFRLEMGRKRQRQLNRQCLCLYK